MTSRRDVLRAGVALSAALATPALAGRAAAADAVFAPAPGNWRRFTLTTRIAPKRPDGGTGRLQAWVPLPSIEAAAWIRPGDNTRWTTNAASATIERDAASGAAMLHLVWADGETAPSAEVTSSAALRDRAVALAAPGATQPLTDAERQRYLRPTALIPTDGIVKETADRITAGAEGELAKARAIYEWVVLNTFRDAAVRGCGLGDIAAMLQTGYLGGKCADLNALYVGLARASGIPARDVYGIRVAASRFGYKSLGANSPAVTKAQHCRAEVHLDSFGWVPVDPADVRKVALEEPPGQLALDDPKVAAARGGLFGAWEGNWIAYNDAHDVALPGSAGPAVAFLMYPQAEVAGVRLDCLDADTFAYSLDAAEISV
ncbi:transglutaminase-like domain-containing protein [Inquilinus limosus]|uniref:Transglutaminase n=1 Tax=Inquilinus limosus TaxID=171674 RepID=A0A211ZC53_9PROT|nr:transglutaminase family protein [Inquilinus limosus]OWJ62707.1 transglutaminase [Inquilinus limosus]